MGYEEPYGWFASKEVKAQQRADKAAAAAAAEKAAAAERPC